MTEASRHNITFYPINPGGLAVFDEPISLPMGSAPAAWRPTPRDLRNRIDNARTLAENTDGIAIVNTNDLTAGMRRIADDVSAYYLLGYYSTNTKFNGGFRKIQVRMKSPGITVKARRGYFAPDETQAADALPPRRRRRRTPCRWTRRSASSAGCGRPRSCMPTRPCRRPSSTIAAEIANGQMASGKWAQGGDLTGRRHRCRSGEAVGTVTAKIEPGSRGALLHVPIAGRRRPGPWQVAFKVTGSGERIEDRLAIARSAATPLLGDATIYRAAPGPRAPLRPVCRFPVPANRTRAHRMADAEAVR